MPDYEILLGDIRTHLNSFLNNRTYSGIAVIVDQNTKLHCLPRVSGIHGVDQIISIRSGEKYKSVKTCNKLWSAMSDYNLDRHSLILNIGGGVIGDMGGFAASCYMRGIDFVQIPTTLLSQVDASVGGKLGVDFNEVKNFIGLFKDPTAVIIDPLFLKTLPFEQLRSGYAEMIKHALIANKEVWDRLTRLDEWTNMDWDREIYDSVQIKKQIVIDDPLEKGLRKTLNFGHTVGHALESRSLQTSKPLLHGEAIALGMMVESRLASRLCGLKNEDASAIIKYITRIYSDIDFAYLTQGKEIMEFLYKDKKNKGGKILCALIEDIGQGSYDVHITESDIISAMTSTLKEIDSFI